MIFFAPMLSTSNSMNQWPVNRLVLIHFFCLVLSAIGWSATKSYAKEWHIPIAGNVFEATQDSVQPLPLVEISASQSHWLKLDESSRSYSIYFHCDREATFEVSVLASAPSREAVLESRFLEQKFRTNLQGNVPKVYRIGSIKAPVGYSSITLERLTTESGGSALVQELILDSPDDKCKVSFVPSNDEGMFYWGRRGASVHLSYDFETSDPIQFAYNEIEVPGSKDVIGSYFMAIGFAEGYFGIQVNSANERRVLFSIWSPFSTDSPESIPEEDRIVLLSKGEKVHVGVFGNEGSGGQSYLVYPWKAETTYCFLTEVRPDQNGNTIYTAWMKEKEAEAWNLIAQFQRPKTQTYLQGFHSFLENFIPEYGSQERIVSFKNTWVVTKSGDWIECKQARFSTDATGSKGYRLDYAGGEQSNNFYLRSFGFFSETTPPGSRFQRASSPKDKPSIDFKKLPR
jgi:hypothetical protein